MEYCACSLRNKVRYQNFGYCRVNGWRPKKMNGFTANKASALIFNLSTSKACGRYLFPRYCEIKYEESDYGARSVYSRYVSSKTIVI